MNLSIFKSRTWIILFAFAMVVIPFIFIIFRLITFSGNEILLDGDLALIDYNVRQAMIGKQQLGVHSRFGFNHPGPTYFYLISIFYYLFGCGAKSLFIGVATINMFSVVAVLNLIRQRTSLLGILWTALILSTLTMILNLNGHLSGTYHHTNDFLYRIISPWNPIVIIIPLVLFITLCAAALNGSKNLMIGASIVGSFVIQTNIATLPFVISLLIVLIFLRMILPRFLSWNETDFMQEDPAKNAQSIPKYLLGILILIAMWCPPVFQQIKHQHGNFSLIYHFLMSKPHGQTWPASFWTFSEVCGTVFNGPPLGNASLGGIPKHPTICVIATFLFFSWNVITLWIGFRKRNRFLFGIGILSLLGSAITMIAIKQIVDAIYGYLVLWMVGLVVISLLGFGIGITKLKPKWNIESYRKINYLSLIGLAILVLIVCMQSIHQVVREPSPSEISVKTVEQLVQVILPHLDRLSPIPIAFNGETFSYSPMVEIGYFMGLISYLEIKGYHPQVNSFFRLMFKKKNIVNELKPKFILRAWTPSSFQEKGYLGRAKDFAVIMSKENP